MATRPNPPGNPQRSQQARRVAPSPSRQSTGSAPAVKSSGALPPVGASARMQAENPTPAPPAAARTAAAPATKPKTQGLAIKTKIVLAMSGLACGVSLLIFVIVMMIATNSLDDTIIEGGTGMLQQAEAIHRPYKAGLNDNGLIAYFNQPVNEGKFKDYWDKMQVGWIHPQVPACREFATFDQFKEDRLWAKVAGHCLRMRGQDPTLDAVVPALLGESWNDVKDLQAGQVAPRPKAPRRVNEQLFTKEIAARFGKLFEDYSLIPAASSFAELRSKVHQETQTTLIDGRSGLRRVIFSQFKADFTSDLDEVTGGEDSKVLRIIFKFPEGVTILPGLTAEDLLVLSPQAEAQTQYTLTPVAPGDIDINRDSEVNGAPAYAFTKGLPSEEIIAVYLDRKQIEQRKQALIFSILGISAVGIGLAIMLAFLIGGSITKPLRTLMSDIQIISGGNFGHQPRARSHDEIGIVSRLLGDMATSLKSAQDVWLENQGRKHDLDVAKEIQENLLPKHVPRIAGYDVSAYYSPSKEVGGDYYDFFLVDKTHLGMVCADVSGKGIPGSMVMMMAKALVSYEAQDNLSPRDIFCKVNRTLAKDIKRGMFVTAFYMLLDIPTARLTVASAGHNPLLLYRAATRQCIEVNPGGIALGFDKDGRLFERNMKEEVIQLQRGDRAVIYTDGVTEAMSPGGEEFGEERFQAITIQSAGKSSAEYLTALVNAIQAHAQTDDQHDDITIVTLKVG